MKKINLIFLFLILSINLASALQVTTNITSIEGVINVDYPINISIYNDFNYTIYDVGILENSYFTIGLIDEMQKNQTIETSVIFNTNITISGSRTLTFNFLYMVNQTLTPNTSYVNITATGFIPQTSQIYKGWDVIFFNKDNLLHSITHNNMTPDFDFDIMPNATGSHTFNVLKNYSIYDKYMGFIGQINVLNNIVSQSIYNPLYDFDLSFNINVGYVNTSLSLNVFEDNYIVGYGEMEEGVLLISNQGANPAVNIHLSSDWISFNENDFTLSPSENNYVTFYITPLIYYTNDTNKNYTKSITAKAINSESIIKNINIFIPYADLGVGGEMSGSWWIQKKIFCDANPTSPICISEPMTIVVQNYTAVIPEYNFSVGGNEISDWRLKLTKIITDDEGFRNWLKTYLIGEVGEKVSKVANDTSVLAKQSQDKKKEEEANTTIWLVFITIALSGILIFSGYKITRYLLGKKYQKQQMNI